MEALLSYGVPRDFHARLDSGAINVTSSHFHPRSRGPPPSFQESRRCALWPWGRARVADEGGAVRKCVARRGSAEDEMCMITASFTRARQRETGGIRLRF